MGYTQPIAKAVCIWYVKSRKPKREMYLNALWMRGSNGTSLNWLIAKVLVFLNCLLIFMIIDVIRLGVVCRASIRTCFLYSVFQSCPLVRPTDPTDALHILPKPPTGLARTIILTWGQKKTYNSGDSPVVTHLTTNPPVHRLSTAERTGSAMFDVLWSYVEDKADSS